MKRYIYLLSLIFTLTIISCSSDSEDESLLGTIYGSVSDKTTGDAVSTVNVLLVESGKSTITGSDGNFSFPYIEPGRYTLKTTKEGYSESISIVNVKGGDPTMAHLLIDRLPASLKVDKTTLDFGETLTQLSFTIVNTGYKNLEYNVETGRCVWLSAEPQSDVLSYGKTATIIVKLDREKLPKGSNEANIVVRSTSGDGNIEIKVKAINNAEASVNTLDVTNLENTSATLNGEVSNPGIPSYTERGFVYDIQATPTVMACIKKLSSPVNSEKTYSCHINELTPTQTYYARAYIVQDGKTIYGNIVSFTTSNQPTTLSTSAVTDITSTSATFNGKILNAGNPAYTERGFCYSKVNGNPTISDTKLTVSGTTTGDYSLTVTNLEYPVTYYVRAYAIQSGTVVYGNAVSFTTQYLTTSLSTSAVTGIGANTATFNGKILNAGEPAFTERGFCYSSSNATPTISDTKLLVAGNTIGDFSVTVNNLSYPKQYYVRVYAIQSGSAVYGNTVTFSTSSTPVSVTTSAATDITSSAATLNGYINAIGSPAYKERGFCISYSGSSEPTINDVKEIVSGTAESGNFSKRISNLEYNKRYSYRAYAIQSGNVVYGTTQYFSTAFTKASVSTMDPSNLGYTSVTFNGTVTDVGDPAITERGFCYSDSYGLPNLSDKKITAGNMGGNFKADVNNLEEDHTYYYRAYVIQNGEPIYGSVKQFDTYYTPYLEVAVTNIKEGSYSWQAEFRGDLADGNPQTIEYGFVYSTATNPTVTTGTKIVGTKYNASGNEIYFNKVVTNLTGYRTYYVRAYAKTALGYTYSTSTSFSTY